MNYDDWRLSGPDEHPEPEMTECDQCDGTGTIERENNVFKCGTCGGSGEVPVEAEEPDGDYEFERRHNAAMDRG